MKVVKKIKINAKLLKRKTVLLRQKLEEAVLNNDMEKAVEINRQLAPYLQALFDFELLNKDLETATPYVAQGGQDYLGLE